MADFYVAKNGNDSNPGTQLLPKKTIGAARNAAAASGDTIHISAGVYHEAVSPNGKAIAFTSDGAYVVVDGLGVLTEAIPVGGFFSTFTGIAFRGFTTRISLGGGAGSFGLFDRCSFDGGNVADGIQFGANEAGDFQNCVFTRFVNALKSTSSVAPAAITVNRCTFFGNTNAFSFFSGSSLYAITNNAFVASGAGARAYLLASAAAAGGIASSSFNNFDLRSGANLGRDTGGATDYADLAAWTTAFPGKEVSSLEVASDFIAEDDHLFVPNAGIPSGLIDAGGAGVTIGAYNQGFGISRNDLEWTGGAHVNTFFAPGNKVKLQPGYGLGTFTTQVKMLPTPQIVSQKRLAVALLEANLLAPGDIETVDLANTDQSREVEIAVNGGPFQAIGYGLTNVFPGTIGQPDQMTVSSLRVRFTLRANGNL